jgi:hypothetical protein
MTSQLAYCVDRKCAGYDFEIEPEPEQAFEIITLRSAARRESSVSKSSVWYRAGRATLATQIITSLKTQRAGQYTTQPQEFVGCFKLRWCDIARNRKRESASLNNRSKVRCV